MQPETWHLLVTGTQKGIPFVILARKVADRWLTTWRLEKVDDWRVRYIFFSNNRMKRFSGKGWRLSDSPLDRILRSYCDASR